MLNYFIKPINLKMWPMFEKINGIGHVECFLATSEMKKGDILFLHVGSQIKKYGSGIYALGEIISNPYILHDHPNDYCNEKNTVDVRILKINYNEPYVSHLECLNYTNQFRVAHKLDYEKGKILYQYIYDKNIFSRNDKRIKTKEDWKKVLRNENQENNIIFDIFSYMLTCKKYTSNGSNIQKALGLNNIPNLDIYRFGQRVIKLLNLPEQVNINNEKIYWNIPFETDYSKNIGSSFSWKLRSELVEALKDEWNIPNLEINDIDLAIEEYINESNPNEFEKSIANEIDIRNEFIEKFNFNSLMSMNINDFVIGRSQIDQNGKNSFCYILETQMKNLGEMRGATVEKFGVWYSKDDGNYKNAAKYGSNVENAYKNIVESICKLIVAGNNDDFKAIKESILPPLFKGKILSTYFPDKYLPIFKEDDVDKFLNLLEISYDVYEYDTLEKKKKLLKIFKNSNKILSKYSDYYFMKFLYDNFKNELKEKHTVNGEIDYNIEFVNFNYIGNHIFEKKDLFRSRETDYEKINRNKKDIGNRGEKAVLNYERNYLRKLGLINLSERVEITENDAIGYDILSFNPDGTEKHIEVKTNSNSSNKILDFYLTDNELNKLKIDPYYKIYYLFNIKKNPKIHIVDKNTLLNQKELFLQPVLYRITIDVEQI